MYTELLHTMNSLQHSIGISLLRHRCNLAKTQILCFSIHKNIRWTTLGDGNMAHTVRN
jgi:hypothetical protein